VGLVRQSLKTHREEVGLTGSPDAVAERVAQAIGGDLHLLRPLGHGAVAHVYLAGETALERLVAVKVLRPELAADEVVRRRFAREARAAARIAHHNVVIVHRVGTLEDGLPFLVMEYVEGRTLEDVLSAGGPVVPERARELLAQVAAALAAAHEKRIIHRDVRPGNILIEDATGRAVLTDFGIAGIKETGSEVVTRLTRASEVLGDPRYASPEQLLGEPITDETDLYSFGVVGYELLTGSGPYAAQSAREMIAAHLKGTPRPLREGRPDLPVELARLLERCLAKKPEHRPQAREVLAALEAMDAGGARSTATGAAAAAAEHEPPFFPALSSFLAELKRRRVYRAAVTYLAAAFVVLQGADIVFPALAVPGWIFPVLVSATLAGFPVVIVLTWIFDLNRGGIERTPDAGELLPGERIARRVFLGIGVLVTVLLTALAAWWLLG
jgi:serine/threonine protein kinase